VTTVYFATNRAPDPASPGGYGAVPVGAGVQATYAVVPVDDVDLRDEASGRLGTVTGVSPGGFTTAVQAEIAASGRNLLIFVHGFDNSFEDAIKRAAFNREWFAASGVEAADTTVVAFTWPSAGVLFDNLPALDPATAYREDQAKAGGSAGHLAAFLQAIGPLVPAIRAAGRRVFLLAHSMGNHALSGAVAHLIADPVARQALTFDEVVLAAADEVDVALTPGGPLAGLRQLTPRVSVYSSLRDIAMDLSMAVNRNQRLGFDGPSRKDDQTAYPPGHIRSVDCSLVADFFGAYPPDATHQYYRRSKAVRHDIATLMAGGPVVPGVSRLTALPL